MAKKTGSFDARQQLDTFRDYVRQVEDFSTKLTRVLGDLRRTLDQFPISDVLTGAELERREKEVAERERELNTRFAKIQAMLRGE